MGAPLLELTDEEWTEVERQAKALNEWVASDEGKASVLAASEKSRLAALRRRRYQRANFRCHCRRY